MANANRGLGKGLGALLGDAALRTDTSDNLYLPISQIEPYANQPRRHFDEEALQDLADSIREHGIIQPLTVRRLSSGYYQIIAGERRWRAARIAGLAEVPAIVIEADDRKMTELSLIENLQREDLDPIEEAEGYKTLMDNYHLTQEEAAERVGKSRSAVANSLRLLGLCPEVRQMLQNGDLSGGHARALLPLKADLQLDAANLIVKQGLSVRQTEALAKRLSNPKEERKPTNDELIAESYGRLAAQELSDYLKNGNIIHSVNMPEVHQPRAGGKRICIIHKNEPGMISQITALTTEAGLNIENMVNKSKKNMAYTMLDATGAVDKKLAEKLAAIPAVIRVRIL